MINSHNGWDTLKEIIVGRELTLSKRVADFTFKYFFQENLNESVYDKLVENGDVYNIRHELLDIRNEQLDNFSKQLEDLGVMVHRPDPVDKVVPFSTPSFKSELSSASNVRDTSIVIGNKLIETPTYVQNRYFENTSLYKVFADQFKQGGQWIHPPHTAITEETMDLNPWADPRDYSADMDKYVMAIDGAQFIRLGDDVICNISSYNHYLGYQWVKSLCPDKNFHTITVTDNHLDGTIIPLSEGRFLVNTNHFTNYSIDEIRKRMPKQYQDWEYIEPEFKDRGKSFDLQLASSRGMDINILNLDSNTIMVNEEGKDVMDLLDKYNYNIIPVKLDNCEIFGGGLHCSTLDINRE
jgi:glycine amidinotransferase